MDIEDYSWNEVLRDRNNHPLFPRSIIGIIKEKPGCGKITLLLNLLLRPGWLDYEKLSVFGKSLFQPEYRKLKEAFEEKLPKESILRLFEIRDKIMESDVSPSTVIEESAKGQKEKSDIVSNFYENGNDVPDPRDLDSAKKNLMVFDDLLLERQNKCGDYYIRGRHSNVDCFYLTQKYFNLPRQTTRENANFIILFSQDLKNINYIYNDHVSQDMSDKEEFKKLCKKAWEKPFGFVLIDLSSDKNEGKYRNGFDDFYFPEPT